MPVHDDLFLKLEANASRVACGDECTRLKGRGGGSKTTCGVGRSMSVELKAKEGNYMYDGVMGNCMYKWSHSPERRDRRILRSRD